MRPLCTACLKRTSLLGGVYGLMRRSPPSRAKEGARWCLTLSKKDLGLGLDVPVLATKQLPYEWRPTSGDRAGGRKENWGPLFFLVLVAGAGAIKRWLRRKGTGGIPRFILALGLFDRLIARFLTVISI